MALVNFWLYQKLQGLYNHDYLNDNAIKALIKDCQQNQHTVKKTAFKNKKKKL